MVLTLGDMSRRLTSELQQKLTERLLVYNAPKYQQYVICIASGEGAWEFDIGRAGRRENDPDLITIDAVQGELDAIDIVSILPQNLDPLGRSPLEPHQAFGMFTLKLPVNVREEFGARTSLVGFDVHT